MGYVPVVISVYHPEGFGTSVYHPGVVDDPNSLVTEPEYRCKNSDWTDTYFPDFDF
ncbi:hypothetical protein [Pseudoalteromonas sp. NBT06-2]|uniref:hypothetical protein n=1 Tax=Pseudoalteromonas sp. NBT06-2 TaxID=2025950 RepID=UPI0014828057|nr:hypothetical protein [Pseudoalteromonas sp. NBT06-2]